MEDERDDNPDIYDTILGRKKRPPERLKYDAQSCNPDTMYHQQAMEQPDRDKFQEAMKKECEAHYKEGNYRLIKMSELPEGATLLSSVWQMKRMRRQFTGEIFQYKARMNVDRSQMVNGLHCEETYAPVV
jgi:hypothetical protein